MGPLQRVSALAGMIATLLLPASVHAQATKPEMPKLRFAVGGKAGIYYLPLTVVERLGYFKDAGLEVEINDLASGARALQAIVGGSAEVGTGSPDHTIQMQAKGQPIVAVVQYGSVPGFVLASIASKPITIKSGQDLKGLKVGVTSPGSSTHFMAAYMMVRSGLKATDASFIGTGATSTAVAAARRGEIDAIVSSDPMMSFMLADNLVKVAADTRTRAGTEAVYGGPFPGGVVYATPAFIERNPNTVQAIATAFVRALKWIDASTPEAIAKVMPADYAMGNPAVYLTALTASKPTYTRDGRVEQAALEGAHRVLQVFDTSVAGATIDIAKTYSNSFVERAAGAMP